MMALVHASESMSVQLAMPTHTCDTRTPLQIASNLANHSTWNSKSHCDPAIWPYLTRAKIAAEIPAESLAPAFIGASWL